MPTTASGIWYPDGNFTANPRVIAAQQAANIESALAIQRMRYGSTEFASTAARDAAFTSPKQGDHSSVAGSPSIYVQGSGWQSIKTTKNMQSTHAEITPTGVATNANHIQAVPVTNITAVDYPRLCIVTSVVGTSTYPASSLPQQMLYCY